MKKIGWFTTARGPGSMNLFKTMLDSMESGEIDAQISFIFINRDVKGNQYRSRMIEMAKERSIPVIIYASDTYRPDLKATDIDAWRDAYGHEVRERISPYKIDFGVLAGYMLIVDPETCRRNILINLHPALPDTYKGTWEEIVKKVVENNDRCYGATVHLCTPELDRGAPIAYDSFDLDELRKRYSSKDELVKQVRAEELKREAHLLMATIKELVDGKLVVREGRLYDRGGNEYTRSPCLAREIDRKTGRNRKCAE